MWWFLNTTLHHNLFQKKNAKPNFSLKAISSIEKIILLLLAIIITGELHKSVQEHVLFMAFKTLNQNYKLHFLHLSAKKERKEVIVF